MSCDRNDGFSLVDSRSDVIIPNSVLCDPNVRPLPFEYMLEKEVEVAEEEGAWKASKPGSFVPMLDVREVEEEEGALKASRPGSFVPMLDVRVP